MKSQTILTSQLVYNGKTFFLRYWDSDDFSDLDFGKCRQIYGVCFCGNKMVVGLNGKKKTWGLVGGTIEKGENLEETLIREIEEESNMKVEKWKPIGVQEATDQEGNLNYQLRAVCIVTPLGDFRCDPAGSITEIKKINPKDYKKYFDWGEIGERIIQRAIKLKSTLK